MALAVAAAVAPLALASTKCQVQGGGGVYHPWPRQLHLMVPRNCTLTQCTPNGHARAHLFLLHLISPPLGLLLVLRFARGGVCEGSWHGAVVKKRALSR